MPQRHIRESIRQVDDNNWIIGDRILLSKSQTESKNCWSDGNGSFFAASAATEPASGGDSKHPFEKVYDVGDAHAVWKIGKAFLKAIISESAEMTSEWTTIEAVHGMSPSFTLPRILFHGAWDGREYLITTEVPGVTLNRAWSSMDDERKAKVATRVAEICAELSTRTCDKPCGVDGKLLYEPWLQLYGNDVESTLRAARELNMDCSKFHFYHCDLGPGNIIVDTAEGDAVGIIDWQGAGYVPREWIRTNLHVCSGLDLQNADSLHDPHRAAEWRVMVGRKLATMGFDHRAWEYAAWREEIRNTR